MNRNEGGKVGDNWFARLLRRTMRSEGVRVRGHYRVECKDKQGRTKWVEEFDNIVVTVGLNSLLDQALGGSTQITTWYLGLKGSGTPAAGDTMASHGTWSEDQNYSQANRVTWVKNAAASSGSITNSSAPAQFSINATTTIHGAFLTSSNTKGGTTGTLYSAGNFSASRSVVNGDTLSVTATFTTADDGV